MTINRLTNTNLDKEILREHLIQRENFWIQKLETLCPKGLNQELNMENLNDEHALFKTSLSEAVILRKN